MEITAPKGLYIFISLLNKKLFCIKRGKFQMLPTCFIRIYSAWVHTENAELSILDLGYVGGVPYYILQPVLERATATQLFTIEEYNPVS